MHHDSKKPNCIVLLSGGLDSTTVLALAKHEQYNCYALSFNYGQRHSIELEAVKKIAKKYAVIEHKILDINFLKELGHSALTDHNIAVPEYNPDSTVIPNTYVPARNTVFISLALGWAEVIKATAIFIGASFIDYSGYKDCRPEYFTAYQKLIDLAVDNITIKTPLLHLSKAETIQLGHSLGVNYLETVSCYQANSQGYACGKCDSCALRKQGFKAANTQDQTCYY